MPLLYTCLAARLSNIVLFMQGQYPAGPGASGGAVAPQQGFGFAGKSITTQAPKLSLELVSQANICMCQ